MIRILIVEDDENISKMLAATLSIGDYEYDRCADGEEAAVSYTHIRAHETQGQHVCRTDHPKRHV